ncbi:MAG: chemotaxis protein MotA [Rhodospirillales bacterium CG15_BIG_FIL_POST_REV_8_21_14_020_66_15]|nr:MAG: chemotaxis protein MotA [Rhodospirillales bacterium CG15_BIG_FIL_POST_REV_8_21_14_020_66_15]
MHKGFSLSTVIGMISGIVLILVAVWATSRDALVFINIPALIIVLGGTIAATLMSFPPRYLLRVWRNFVIALRNETVYVKDDVDEIVQIAKLWNSRQIHKVEEELANVRSPFLRTGVQLVIDNSPIEDIQELLEWRIARLKLKEQGEANVFRTMGSYAPAFGMVGTLIGLVNMLYDMSHSGFEQLGLNMAVALITTFYGLLFANLVFKPIASVLENRTNQRVRTLSMVVEAVNLLSQKRSPSYIRETLYSFLAEYEDELDDKGASPAARPEEARKA